MSAEHWMIALLSGLLVSREIFNQFTVQKLLDKAMSRNYYEYEQAVALSKKQKEQEIKKSDPLTFVEDFAQLDDFGLN